jgi:hypothetical protein
MIWLVLFVSSALTALGETAPDFEPNIPVIFLELPGALQIGQKVPGTVRLQYPKGKEAAPAGPLKAIVRYRGAVSLGYEKKSMALELSESVSLLGMQNRAHWILNAAYIDRSLMRHKLSYDFYLAMSSKESPRYAAASRFVEVFMNGQYHGVYLLMERVDRRLLGFKAFEKADADHACIYKSVDHSARFNQNGHDGYEQQEPNPLTEMEYWQPIDELNRFANKSRGAAFFDKEHGIGSKMDVGSVIDFHLLLLITSNMDSPTKNFIIARDAAKNGVPSKFFFVPWDMDATFGRNWEASRVRPTEWLSNYLYDRMLEDSEYRARFLARWKSLREGPLSIPAMHAMIDENVRALGEAARRNAKRWPTNTGNYPDSLTFEQDIAQMKDWVKARGQWLDRTIIEMTSR